MRSVECLEIQLREVFADDIYVSLSREGQSRVGKKVSAGLLELWQHREGGMIAGTPLLWSASRSLIHLPDSHHHAPSDGVFRGHSMALSLPVLQAHFYMGKTCGTSVPGF